MTAIDAPPLAVACDLDGCNGAELVPALERLRHGPRHRLPAAHGEPPAASELPGVGIDALEADVLGIRGEAGEMIHTQRWRCIRVAVLTVQPEFGMPYLQPHRLRQHRHVVGNDAVANFSLLA